MKDFRRKGMIAFILLILIGCDSQSVEKTYSNKGIKQIIQKHNDIGIELAVQSKFKESALEFNKALKIDPFNIRAKFALEIIRDQNSQKISKDTASFLFKAISNINANQAIDTLNSAINSAPDYALAYNERGNAYLKKGHFAKAISDFTRAIDINPRFVEAYNNRGVAYQNKGNIDMAISDYNKALNIDPMYAEAYTNRGLAYEEGKGQIDRAISDHSKALDIDPQLVDAYYNRGTAYAKSKGMHNKAISDFNKALEIDPMDASAYDNRGYVYVALLNNLRNGCSDFKRACDLGKCQNYNTVKQQGYCK